MILNSGGGTSGPCQAGSSSLGKITDPPPFFTIVSHIGLRNSFPGIFPHHLAIYLVLFTRGSSQRGGSARRGVAKQPSSRPHKDRIIERADGSYTTRETERIEEQAAICVEALERENLAKR